MRTYQAVDGFNEVRYENQRAVPILQLVEDRPGWEVWISDDDWQMGRRPLRTGLPHGEADWVINLRTRRGVGTVVQKLPTD